MLEGRDGVVWKDHVRNCALCHLPNVDGTVDPSLAVVWAGLKCMLYGSRGASCGTRVFVYALIHVMCLCVYVNMVC
jgi:hypothetical protein